MACSACIRALTPMRRASVGLRAMSASVSLLTSCGLRFVATDGERPVREAAYCDIAGDVIERHSRAAASDPARDVATDIFSAIHRQPEIARYFARKRPGDYQGIRVRRDCKVSMPPASELNVIELAFASRFNLASRSPRIVRCGNRSPQGRRSLHCPL